MPKIDLNAVTTDGTADQINKDLEAKLKELMAQDRALENELLMRATNDGDLRMLVDVYTDRVAEKDNRLKDGSALVLASANGKGVDTRKGGGTGSPEAEAVYQRLLQMLGTPMNIEDWLDRASRESRQGKTYEEFVLNFLDALEDNRDQLVMISGRPVPNSIVTNNRYVERLTNAFNAVQKELGVAHKDDPMQVAKAMSDEIGRLKAIPISATIDEATILAEVVKVTGVPSLKDETLEKYMDRVGNADLVTFRTNVAMTLGIPRTRKGQPDMTDAEWHTELVKGAGWYSAAWKSLFEAAIDPKNVFKLDADKAEKLNIVNLVKAMVDAAVANSPAKVLTDPSAQEISDYLYNQLGYKDAQLNGKNAYQLFVMLTGYVNAEIRNHYSGLSAKPVSLRSAELVDDYKLRTLPTPAPAV
jgi:hypothetical protein